MAVPPAYAEVRYAPDPNSHLQAVGRDAAGRLQYRYHSDWEKVREQRKAHRLARLVAALPKIRRNVSMHLSAISLPANSRFRRDRADRAHAIRRATNPTPAQRTRGATTLLKSNVVLEDDCLVLTSRQGRQGRAQGMRRGETRSRHRHPARVPGKRMFQYRDHSGNVRAVSTTQVNAFLREIAGIKISLKDFVP